MSDLRRKEIFSKKNSELYKIIKKQEKEIELLKKEYEKQIYTLNYVLQNTPGSLYWKNSEGAYLGHNKFAANLMHSIGLEDDIVGKTDYDLFDKEIADNFRKSDLQVLNDHVVVIEEVTKLPNEKQLIQLSSKIPLRDKKNHIVGVIGNTIDITDRKQAEIIKQEFLMNMAHDLRTPLAGIIGLANLQATEGTSPQEKEYGEMIQGAGEQLLDLLNSVLKILDAEQTTQQIKAELIYLPELARELQLLMGPSIQTKGLQFQVKLSTNLPVVVSDHVKLKRILLNLLSNAVKFTKQGKITLAIKLFSIENNQAKIQIRISDTGIGIAKDKRDKIFDRFYRAHPSFSAEYSGYGIGLYLVKNTLELLGGKIAVASEEGKGSCFTLHFSFPISHAVVNKSFDIALKQPIAAFNAKSEKKVLLAEDNLLILHAVKKSLENLGYVVTTVTEGKAALQALQTQAFTWALLDIGLPGLEGTEVVHRYRHWEQEKDKRRMPIFALTAHGFDKIEKKCKEVGLDHVFIKPFKAKDIQVIEQYL